MIIEFELQGSKSLHKGIFDTAGFWIKYEPEMDEGIVQGYKIFSHFSFAFYHTEKKVADAVYAKLIRVIMGNANVGMEEIIENAGYIRKLNK